MGLQRIASSSACGSENAGLLDLDISYVLTHAYVS